MEEIIHGLSENLNTNVIENKELEIATIELDESYVGKRRILNGYGLFFIVLPGRF